MCLEICDVRCDFSCFCHICAFSREDLSFSSNLAIESEFFLVTTVVLNVQDGSCNGLQHYAALGRDQVIFFFKILVYTAAYTLCVT